MFVPRKIAAAARAGRARRTATAAAAAVLAPATAHAAAGYTLPGSGASGILGQIETKMTELANFVSQPLGVFVVICAFVFAAALWIFAPKSGALSYGFRAVAALIVVFNLTAIVTYFTF